MARAGCEADRTLVFADDGWSFTIHGDDSDREGWAGTLLALSNGAIGVRGAIEERAHASTFLAHAYEQVPIHYHERLKGFADRSDSRVPVVETLELEIRIDGIAFDPAHARSETRQVLDLRSGVLRRETCWRLSNGSTLIVQAERLVPLDGRPLLLRRLRAMSPGTTTTLHPKLAPAPRPARQSHDPRIGVELASLGFATERASDDLVVERLAGSGIGVAAVQGLGEDDGWTIVATGLSAGREPSDRLVASATELAHDALTTGFAATAVVQERLLADFWSRVDLAIDGEPKLTAALRTNLFHLFASAGRDGRSSAAAKGLTGEGYEGHYFWDAEAFMLPVLAVTAPEIARAMLVYRASTLDAATANARALDHRKGALFAWRTIEGRECSAHYPSGSAQYHINAAIAFAIGLYADATDDREFLAEYGVRMLIETARLWVDLGDWADGVFHLRGVTGPDEYTALVDDNWYTNRMAQKHLRLAVDVAARVAAADPDRWAEQREAIGLSSDELVGFALAADAMALPYDAERDLDAQDANFLDGPPLDFSTVERPLLLHHHPLTLYRHQVSKQADLILGLVLGGEGVSLDRKRRAYAHYEPITTHDSTLSASTFAILAAEIGEEEAALAFMRETSFVDIDDKHGNTSHGVHMAALAGSWMALVWGFGGFRPTGDRLTFRPTLPSAWSGYRFGLVWRGTTVQVEITGGRATYRAVSGPPIAIGHHDTEVSLAAGEDWSGPLSP